MAELDGLSAHIEPLTLVLRIYPPGGSYAKGDPYLWHTTLCRISPGVYEAIGAASKPPPGGLAAIARLLLSSTTYQAVIFRRSPDDEEPFVIDRARAARLVGRLS